MPMRQRYEAAIEPLLADPEIDAVLALNCPTAVADGMATAEAVLRSPCPAHGAAC